MYFVHLGCNECKDGWVYTDEAKGCIDIDECLEQDVCTVQQFCDNNEGSYACLSKWQHIYIYIFHLHFSMKLNVLWRLWSIM